MDSSLESLWKTYDTINEWIRLADTKAAVVLAAQAVIIGLVLGAVPDGPATTVLQAQLGWALPGAIFTGLVAALFALWCINPILKVGEPRSVVFFAHVAKGYSKPECYAKDALEMWTDSDKAAAEVSCQVWANSKVAWRKYWRVTVAIIAFAVNLIFSVLALWFSVS